MKHRRRFLGGIGLLTICYGTLRSLENRAAIYFMIAYIFIGYGLGWFVDCEE